MKTIQVLLLILATTSFQLAHSSSGSNRIQEKRDARRDRREAIRNRGAAARRPTPTPAAYVQSLTLQGKTGTLAERLYRLLKDQYEGRNDHGVTNIDGTLFLVNNPYEKVDCTQVGPANADTFRCRLVGPMKLGTSEYLGARTYYNVTISTGLLFSSVAGKLFRLVYNTTPSAVTAQDSKTDYFQVKIAETGDAKSPHTVTCELEGVSSPVALDVRKVSCHYRGIERPVNY
jgi:type II secretory pathway pseudopilin PulG